jgi:hypothetical protein
MRAFVLTLVLLGPSAALAENQLACQKKCERSQSVCEDQCELRFPKGKQNECKHACKGAKGSCEDRCQGDKKK